MKWLPLFCDFAGQHGLVVGGGTIALSKARLLAKAGLVVDVIAPEIEDELVQIAHQSGGSVQEKAFDEKDVPPLSPRLVVAATSISRVNEQVAQVARDARILVNIVDKPELCTVIFPSIVDRGQLVLALSSGGQAPTLLRQWREKLEALLPAQLGDLVSFAGNLRASVKATLPDIVQRRRFWESFFAGPAATAILVGQKKQAQAMFEQMLEEEGDVEVSGEVYLVGAGPGNPDLLTLRALHLMQQADVVLYDNLVSTSVLDLCRRESERVYVGKKRNYKSFRQEAITQLLVDYAKEGKRVLRLKGGDPFVFGRGGEEIEGLAQHKIPFQVVPGITAASGCAAYAGIPLTHRDYAQSVQFITGHLKQDDAHLNWPELMREGQTLVFYMGRKNLPLLVNTLLKRGRAADTPVAVVENGTLPQQRVLVGCLGDISELVRQASLTGPTVAIVGDVVRLRKVLGYS